MNLLDKHKALLITVLITGTVIMALFSFHLEKQANLVAETFYELPPPLTPEEILLEELAMNEQSSQDQTNKAFNEADEFKEVMKNFKSLNSNDFDKTTKETETEDEEVPEEVTDVENTPTPTTDPSINEDELSSYSKINNVIAMRSAQKRQSAASNGDNSTKKTGVNSSVNRNSSVSYSLKGRKDEFLPPPVYLCEEGGKVIINITVNSNGDVIDTDVNNSSTSSNQCLIYSALEYAKTARFNTDGTKSQQVGTITYIFKGKN